MEVTLKNKMTGKEERKTVLNIKQDAGGYIILTELDKSTNEYQTVAYCGIYVIKSIEW